MTLTECSSLPQAYSTERVVTVSGNGTVLTSLAKPPTSSSWGAVSCEGGPVAAYDSTIYVVESKQNNGYTEYRIAAYKLGTQLWNYSLELCTSSPKFARPKWLTLGHDDNLYAVMDSPCTTSDVLVGLNAATGTSLFTPIPFTQSVSSYELWHSPFATYAGGLVMLDNNKLKYYNYGGQSNATSYSVPIGSGESFVRVAYGDNGRAAIAVSKSGVGCSGVYRVDYHDPSGASGSYPTATQCPSIGHLRVLPGGGVLLKHGTLNESKLMKYDGTGLVYNVNIFSISGYSQLFEAWPQVDSNGTVVVIRSGVNSSGDRHVLVDTVSPTGTVQRVWDTLSMATSSTDTFRYTQGERLSMELGSLYVPICAGTCSASNPVKVYKVAISGLGYDYPRSGWIDQPLKYVALGDSFSSGDGVPPFLAGTDTQTNECHRSVFAYSRLLDQDMSLSLRLINFRACSGATTETLVSGQGDNGNQLSSISADTDVVTLTIGGNDVNFAEFARECVLSDCSNGPQASSTQSKIDIDLPNQLDTLFAAIDDRLAVVGNTGAKIYVVGYPRILPYDDGTWPNCLYLNQDERVVIRTVTNALNSTVSDRVLEAGSRYVFVSADAVLDGVRISPFATHELCSDGQYFVGVVNGDPQKYSMHPNQQGQGAYARLLSTAINP
jgi:hypothetical protein